MGKIVSKALQLRLEHQRKLGRTVTPSEVSKTTGINRLTLRKIERNGTRGVDFDTLERLCAFYGVGVGEILEYDPSQIRTSGLVASVTN